MSDGASIDAKQTKRPPRWLTWLHRVGYVTTPVVLLLLVAIGCVGMSAYLESSMPRTFEGPIQVVQDTRTDRIARERLRLLPPLNALHGNGLRFIIVPSIGGAEYSIALALATDAPAAEGLLVVGHER